MSGELSLTRPDPRTDRDALFDLTAKSFGHGGYWQWVRYCRQGYIDHSHYDWNSSTIGRIDGELVTHWGVWGYRMRIGRAQVRVAGIGAVCTHGEYRSRGLMARTATHGLEVLRRQGYDLSLLFGIRDFYHRFGYVPAWPATRCTVSVEDLPESPPPRLRRFTSIRSEEVNKLYNRHDAGLTGSAVRPTFARRIRMQNQVGYGWRDRRGRLKGYVLIREPGNPSGGKAALECLEGIGEPEQVLRALGRLARRRGRREVRLPALPQRTSLAGQLRRRHCRLEQHYQPSGGAMIRTVNLTSTLEKVAPELEARLRDSCLSGWRGRLTIDSGRDAADLRIGKPGVRAAPCTSAGPHALRGGDAVARLLLGSEQPGEILHAPDIQVTGEAARLVRTLFPAQQPMLRPMDRF